MPPGRGGVWKVQDFFRKLGLIIWKNLYLRKNQYCVTLWEILFPIMPILIFLLPFMIFKINVNLAEVFAKNYTNYDAFNHQTLMLGEEGKMWCNVSGDPFDPKTDNLLAYTPINPETTSVMQQLANDVCPQGSINIVGVDETDLEAQFDTIWRHNENFRGAIVFPDELKELAQRGSRNGTVSYTIRLPSYKLPSTRKLFPVRHPSDLDFIKMVPRFEPRTPEKMIDDNDYYPSFPSSSGDQEQIDKFARKHEPYIGSGFIRLQVLLDKILTDSLTSTQTSIRVTLQPFPYGATVGKVTGFIHAIFVLYMQMPYFCYCFGICFMIPAITRNMVSEKQTGITELLRMSGVSSVVQWLGWFVHVILPQFFTITLLVLIMFAKMANEPLMTYTDRGLLWGVLLLYMFATAAMTFFVCSLFQKPTIATAVAELVMIVTFTMGYAYSFAYPYWSYGLRLGLSVFPNIALAVLFRNIGYLEYSAKDDSDLARGAQWSDFGEKVYVTFPSLQPKEYAVSNLEITLMLLADTVIYMLLAFYFDGVLPSEFGVKRPWHFFNFEWARRGKRQGRVVQAPAPLPEELTSADTMVIGDTPMDPAIAAHPGFEAEPVGVPVGLEVINMVKKFGRKVAVNGVSLRMYTGDIYALLGHNGAGKTTLISMLTGFFLPTAGTAVINGVDIRQDMDKARESLGVCPQHNMLFDRLTVFQQLRLFGMIRGLTKQQSRDEADLLMEQMRFFDKARTQAIKLSGGQKRKVSLAMALIGGTKVAILDEPTSGMDPQARREIWDILLQVRKDRTLLLTTHYMEEADVLGDRIGIMANGTLLCQGSSDFLKKYYGTGYTLKLTFFGDEGKEEKNVGDIAPPSTTEIPPSPFPSQQDAPAPFEITGAPVKPNPKAEVVLAAVRKYVPSASFKLERQTRGQNPNNEAFINLPGEGTTTAVITQMFADLVPRKDKLGIKTIGLAEASMDDVFIKVGEKAEEEAGRHNKLEDDSLERRPPKVVKCHRVLGQFSALLMKKLIYSTRKWIMLIFEMLLPLVIFAYMMVLVNQIAKSFVPASLPTRSQSQGRSLGASGRMSAPTLSGSGVPLEISWGSYSDPVLVYSRENGAAESKYLVNLPGATSEPPDDFRGESYVARKLQDTATRDKVAYKRRYIVAEQLTQNQIKAWYNLYPYHAAPLALNVAANTLLSRLAPSQNYQIRVTNQPFEALKPEPKAAPKANNNKDEGIRQSVIDKPVSSFVTLALIFLVASFVINPIEERICKCKQLQTMTGVNPAVYWGATSLWDYSIYIIIVFLMTCYLLIADYGVGYKVLSRGWGIPVFLFIVVSYGFAATFMSYLISFRSSSVTGGFSLVTLLHIITGLCFGIIIPDADFQLYTAAPAVYYVIEVFKGIFRLDPTFSLVRALTFYGRIAEANSLCFLKGTLCPEPQAFLVWDTKIRVQRKEKIEDASLPGIGQEVFYVLLMGLVYFGLVMLIDFKIFWWMASRMCKDDGHAFVPNMRDEDVKAEADRVNDLVGSGQVGSDCVLVQNLSKSYGTFASVNRLHFGVHHGECFGLLGINGAGKTTAFKMLTGDELPSFGSAFGFGSNLDWNGSRFYSHIGYCPQFDGILPLFTGKQMLQLFAGLRGIPSRLKGQEAIVVP